MLATSLSRFLGVNEALWVLFSVPLTRSFYVDIWQELIDDCLAHIEPEIQSAAVAAIPAFFTEFYRQPDGSAKKDIQGKYADLFNLICQGIKVWNEKFVHVL